MEGGRKGVKSYYCLTLTEVFCILSFATFQLAVKEEFDGSLIYYEEEANGGGGSKKGFNVVPDRHSHRLSRFKMSNLVTIRPVLSRESDERFQIDVSMRRLVELIS